MNNNPRIKKRFITLIEIIIVMFFITIITGVIAYNIKGALDEGKAFKTLESMKQIDTILNMELSNDSIVAEDIDNGNYIEILKRHPLIKNWKSISKDGWGEAFVISYSEEDEGIVIESNKYNKYTENNPSLFKNK